MQAKGLGSHLTKSGFYGRCSLGLRGRAEAGELGHDTSPPILAGSAGLPLAQLTGPTWGNDWPLITRSDVPPAYFDVDLFSGWTIPQKSGGRYLWTIGCVEP